MVTRRKKEVVDVVEVQPVNLDRGVSVDVQLENATAKAPTYATDGSGAFDLYSNEDCSVVGNKPNKISLGCRFAIPSDYLMVICPRSSIGMNTPLRQANSIGIIDSDYRGIVCALYENNGMSVGSRNIRRGDRIAQGFLVPKVKAKFNLVDELSSTDRGEGGFGSTGV